MDPIDKTIAQLQGTAAQDGPQAALARLERDAPDRTDLRLACLETELILDCGNYDRGLRLARELHGAHPAEPGALVLLADALELCGRFEEAYELITRAPPDSGLAHRVDELRDLAAQQHTQRDALDETAGRIEPAHSLQEAVGADVAAPKSELLARLLHLFQGHPAAFAMQVRLGNSARFGYRPIRRGLSREDLLAHLRGDRTLGVYFLDSTGSTRLACWDLDIRESILQESRRDPDLAKRLRLRLARAARSLCLTAEKAGLPLTVESSGRKGLHFWLFCPETAAREIRILGRWLLDRAGPPGEGLSWEFFPKQDMPGPKGLGNLVKLPLGIHRGSGRRSLFLDSRSLRPYRDQPGAVMRLVRLRAEELASACGRAAMDGALTRHAAKSARRRSGRREAGSSIVTEAAYSELDQSESRSGPPREGEGGDRDGAGTAPPQPEPIPIRIPLPDTFKEPVQSVVRGCDVLSGILGRCRRNERLNPRERHVLIYIGASLGEAGALLAHQALAQAPDYDPDQVNRELLAVGPTAMGCARIGQLLPRLAGADVCRCRFRLPARGYPAPMAHAGLYPVASGRLSRGSHDRPSRNLEAVLRREIAASEDPVQRNRLKALLADRVAFLEREARQAVAPGDGARTENGRNRARPTRLRVIRGIHDADSGGRTGASEGPEEQGESEGDS